MSETGSAAIALCNPKSPSNVGAVMRAAGCYGASAIYYTGTRFERAAKYHLDTRNISQQIPLSSINALTELMGESRKLVCVELAEGAIPLPEFTHPEDALYIFGPEDGSIDQSVVDLADAVVYVPTIGCMNLAATVNVLLYDRMAKQSNAIDHRELIKQSRDVNNRLVYKR
ncbi:tRNA(Leu) C34 or U34 (ribose-2'-O)-methylase TrmL, contains SPOUT domain [Amphritea atlantica]|uniref:tRNA(Leu) C34 or U34 (Ribose-2'-O)-methylase TrmL, contains SPOUT domain n=1 Tax=Amphritea atlantica TaxID=355243 RepID=A0A1H9DCH3_9GAMM|nr:tRNA(Leu) C34 or U34 (ribose-2'-O)-methylase TrmL, contains SPOUT domain [Amphritea atlantica]